RALDGLIMRIMDGIMAIPAVLLAIAMVSVSGSSLTTVIVAIAVPEVPRVTRLVRSIMLSVRNEPYVEAAITLGTSPMRVLLRHMLPNTVAPLIVQGTYIFAAAVLIEAILSFLGAGIPPEVPSWGNIIADGRSYFQLLPGLVMYPGIVLSLTILTINMLGDAARDALDPKLAARNS
ncbi:MAG TPA: ABC transporter permease, partial [Castellaniella sp.]|nr:ABC transporter permease [Castellaniella sp.]